MLNTPEEEAYVKEHNVNLRKKRIIKTQTIILEEHPPTPKPKPEDCEYVDLKEYRRAEKRRAKQKKQKAQQEAELEKVRAGRPRYRTNRPLPTKKSKVITTEDQSVEKGGWGRNARSVKYVTMDVKGSGGQTYKVVIPRGYVRLIPIKWVWNAERYKVAEMLSAGYNITKVAESIGVNRVIIYGWLQHPEFKDHVDGLTMESGWANQRERIAGLNRVSQILFKKLEEEFGNLKLTDRSVGPILMALQALAKQLGQEKGEFIEQSQVTQNMSITGAVGIATMDLNAVLQSKPKEEKEVLEAEWREVGDDIIRSITGEKD